MHLILNCTINQTLDKFRESVVYQFEMVDAGVDVDLDGLEGVYSGYDVALVVFEQTSGHRSHLVTHHHRHVLV